MKKQKKNENEKVCVLISCMNQTKEIVNHTNVQSDVVVINQCNIDDVEEWCFRNKYDEQCYVKFISTTERGLSRSRNMAIRNCQSEICLVCDDDEVLADDYPEMIREGYSQYPDAGVIAFAINDGLHTFPSKAQKLGFKTILRSNSQQITFKREIINQKGISFDTKMGSGTGNGGGEEIKFLLDCRRNALKMYYHPNCITTVHQNESQWFHGYTDSYFVNFGWTSRRLLGPLVGFAYMTYFMLSHGDLIKKDNTVRSAFIHSLMGWRENR